MAFSATILQRGVCGNFRFKIYTITDAANTNSVIKTNMHSVKFVASTNTTDNADHFKAQTLSWTGTADGNTANELVDSSETYVKELTGLMVWNTTDNVNALIVYKDADELYTFEPATKAALDAFPDGNETYTIKHEGHIILDPVTADDDGTLIIMGD